MMNIYSGSVVTDASGLATVKLPDYFEVLNRDFRYQFTVVRQFPQAIVLQKVHHHSFDIETGKPGVEVSWQVTGTRQDAYAKRTLYPRGSRQVRRGKGHYLHPELFGACPNL